MQNEKTPLLSEAVLVWGTLSWAEDYEGAQATSHSWIRLKKRCKCMVCLVVWHPETHLKCRTFGGMEKVMAYYVKGAVWLMVCCIISHPVGNSMNGPGLLSAQHRANPKQKGVWGETQTFYFICTLCRCCSNAAPRFWGAPAKHTAETNIIFTIRWCSWHSYPPGCRYKQLVKVVTASLT